MIKLMYIAEDSALTATIYDASNASVDFADCATGREEHREMTPQQLGAIMALAIAGEFNDDDLLQALYNIAEPVVEGMTGALRPIP